MSTSFGYVLRSISALLLMIGFYGLALAIAGGLLYLIYIDVTVASTIHLRLVIGALIGAATILWAILPRPDRFEPPGPELGEREQPALFEDLRAVADGTGQAMPEEVYLVPDVNAWVSQRGGVMGFGSRRVMGLGLPLLQGLTRDQMRGVIAHEFGHYHGGDTRLGPLLYRTRAAIGRTVESLGNSLLQAPFRWYGAVFLRITHATSRRQEFAADALSARLFGSRPLIGGLRALPGLTEAFPAFWMQEIIPALNAGYRPPLAEGFARFVAHPRVAAEVARVRDVALGESAGDPYDTHPPLPERIAALERLGAGDPPSDASAADASPAATLLADPDRLERSLLIHMYGEEPVSKLNPIRWEECGAKVFLPEYRNQVRMQKRALSGITLSNFAALTRDPSPVARLLVFPGDGPAGRKERRLAALQILASAMIVGLHDAGWTIRTGPGEPVVMSRGDRTLAPFELVDRLHQGKVPADEWNAIVAVAGLGERDLGEPPVDPAAADGVT